MAEPDNDMSDFLATTLRCLSGALNAMNTAVLMTVEHGPAKAMEYIADYLNETDAVDEDSEPDRGRRLATARAVRR